MNRATRFLVAVTMAVSGAAALGAVVFAPQTVNAGAGAGAEVIVAPKGGSVRKIGTGDSVVGIFGPSALAPLKESIKADKPLRAYLEGVSFPKPHSKNIREEAVDVKVFLATDDAIDHNNFLGSIGNVASGHDHGDLTLTFEVKDFRTVDDQGNVLAEGRPYSVLKEAVKKSGTGQVYLVLLCKTGAMNFGRLRLTDVVEEE